ncbi:MAG TPA: DUF11 domain-containing protein [Bryobacteraceae bacterium]|nr:DUF11 domain-containing protein [Bryobacteraceae bacterium]
MTLLLASALLLVPANQAFAQGVSSGPVVGQALGPFVFNGDLRSLPNADLNANAKLRSHPRALPTGLITGPPQGGPPDPLLPPSSSQKTASSAPFIASPIVNFDGTPGGDPPDTNGVVGPNHYIQTINVVYAIWDKTGKQLVAPTNFTSLFGAAPATGTSCDGTGPVSDPVVLYDPLADRWILTILAGTSFKPEIGPFYECIAISKTNDPVSGGWFKYALKTDDTALSDFPKLGVWPDAYYFSANMYPSVGKPLPPTFPRVWALDRNTILGGGLMHEVHFDVPVGFFWLLPENMHGTPPPAGEKNVFAAVDFNNNNIVDLWNFHVDWVTPSNSTFGDGTHNPDHTVNVAAYTHLSQNIPQPGTTVVSLDALGGGLDYPAQYRSIGGTESLWLNHTVDTGGNVAGIRWYEIHDPSGSPTLFQQGTWNNTGDGVHRWMGAIGADQFGNMAIGYTVSSDGIAPNPTLYPGIRYAGRLADDPLGMLAQGEGTLIAGTSNIINCTPDASKGQTTCVGRWGDYGGMSVDPVDDCTFWFTNEYVAGGNNKTRIGAVALPGCNADVSVTKTAPATVAAGTNLSYTIVVSNGGLVTAEFVTLTDTTPLNTTFVGLSQNGGPTFDCTTAPDTLPAVGGTGAIQCSIAALANGDFATFTLVVKVNPSAQGTIVQTANVSAYELDPNTGNNTASVSSVVIQSADLSVTKTCKPDTTSALAGTTAYCTMVVTNNGPSDASGVSLSDTIVASTPFTIGTVAMTQGSCSATPGTITSGSVTCSLGTIPAGTTATVTVNFSAQSGGTIEDNVSVTSTTPDPNNANNTATGAVTYISSADLSITKTALPSPVVAGANLTYIITASNAAGPSMATNVVVKDTLPGQVSVVSVTPSVGTCSGGIPGNPAQPLICTLGSLIKGGSATITVVVKVNSSTPDGTILINNASIGSEINDPNNANNVATVYSPVVAHADLAIVKTSDKAIYKPTSTVTYTINVTNNGPSDALAVIVTDNLPTIKQAHYQSDTGGCTLTLATDVLTCNLGTMPTGTTKSFNIYELIIGNKGAITNTASVTSATTDPNTANNTSTRIVGVK